MTIDEFTTRFENCRKTSNGYQASCPCAAHANGDRRPSLSIAEHDGTILVHCKAGCSTNDVLATVGLSASDLFADHPHDRNGNGHHSKAQRTTTSPHTYPNKEKCIDMVLHGIQCDHLEAQHVATYDYRRSDGGTFCHVLRVDTVSSDGATDKTFRPISQVDGDRWVAVRPKGADGGTTPSPLYRQDEIGDAGVVFLVEGEKCVDLLRSLGLAAVTSMGGANGTGTADWSALSGLQVAVLPDNDPAGETYLNRSCRCMAKLDDPPTVKVLRLEGVGPKGDIEQWLELHDAKTPEELHELLLDLADAAPEWESTEDPADEKDSVAEPGRDGIDYQVMSFEEFMKADFTVEYLIENVLAELQPFIIGGASKTLKTSVALDIAISLASGSKFLGRFPAVRSCHVVMMSAESGASTLQESMRRMIRSKRVDTGPDISVHVPLFESREHLLAVERMLDDRRPEVLIVDPTYMCMSGENAGNIFARGVVFRAITEICVDRGCLLAIVHHTKGNTGKEAHVPPGLEDLSWAGFSAWARQWLLLGRRSEYVDGTGDHELWMRVGSSIGHSSLSSVDIHEGQFQAGCDRLWEVEVTGGKKAITKQREQQTAEVAVRKEEQAEAKIERHRKKIIESLVRIKGDDRAKTDIRDLSGLNSSDFGRAFGSLLMDGTIEKDGTKKAGNGHEYDIFKAVK